MYTLWNGNRDITIIITIIVTIIIIITIITITAELVINWEWGMYWKYQTEAVLYWPSNRDLKQLERERQRKRLLNFPFSCFL